LSYLHFGFLVSEKTHGELHGIIMENLGKLHGIIYKRG